MNKALIGRIFVQQEWSVLDGNPELLALCAELNLGSIDRSPLNVPIPGFKNVCQVEENCNAIEPEGCQFFNK